MTEFLDDTPGANQTTITREVTTPGDPIPHAVSTIHTHDPEFKLLLSIENPLGDTVKSYGYDDHKNRTSITDRNGNTTTFGYDDRGHVVSTTEPDDPLIPTTAACSVEYEDPDFPDVPTKQTDALGYVIEWTYDDVGNVSTERRYLDLARTEWVEKSWTYNGFGQRLTKTDERGDVPN